MNKQNKTETDSEAQRTGCGCRRGGVGKVRCKVSPGDVTHGLGNTSQQYRNSFVQWQITNLFYCDRFVRYIKSDNYAIHRKLIYNVIYQLYFNNNNNNSSSLWLSVADSEHWAPKFQVQELCWDIYDDERKKFPIANLSHAKEDGGKGRIFHRLWKTRTKELAPIVKSGLGQRRFPITRADSFHNACPGWWETVLPILPQMFTGEERKTIKESTYLKCHKQLACL